MLVHYSGPLRFTNTADTDSPSSIKERAAKKLHIDNTSELSATYEWNLVRYALEDGMSILSLTSILLPPKLIMVCIASLRTLLPPWDIPPYRFT